MSLHIVNPLQTTELEGMHICNTSPFSCIITVDKKTLDSLSVRHNTLACGNYMIAYNDGVIRRM